MRSKTQVAFICALFLAISISTSVSSIATAANPDDGYPQGQPAPGRTCPNNDVGHKIISEFNGKTFTCTIINGEKKWWIEGEPLPFAPAKPSEPAKPNEPTNSGATSNSGSTSSSEDNMPPGFKHTYFLPAKSIAKMKVIEDVIYSDQAPGQKLDIYLPKGVANPPLMIWIHGGGMIFGTENTIKYDEGAKLLEVLIKNGIAVASINYRLANEVKFPATGQDVKTAIRFLRAKAAKYGYNSKKFVTGGDSAGAYLALMAAFTANQKSVFDNPNDPNLKTSASVSAVFDLFGNSNFTTMTENKIKYPCTDKTDFAYGTDPKMNPWLGGDVTLPENKSMVDSANLYPFLKSLKPIPNVYVFHGTADCSVSKYDSIELDKVVKSLKGKSSLYLIPGAAHGGAKIWVEVMKQVPALAKYLATIK